MELYFLTLEDVLEIHADQMSRYGGKMGLRDRNLLLSAIAQPSIMFGGQYLHKSLYDKAAAYLFIFAKTTPLSMEIKGLP